MNAVAFVFALAIGLLAHADSALAQETLSQLKARIDASNGRDVVQLGCHGYDISSSQTLLIDTNVQLSGCGDATSFNITLDGSTQGGSGGIVIEGDSTVEIERVALSIDADCSTGTCLMTTTAGLLVKGASRVTLRDIRCSSPQPASGEDPKAACIATRADSGSLPNRFVLRDSNISSGTRFGVYLEDCEGCVVENTRFAFARSAAQAPNTYLLATRNGAGVVLQNNFFDMETLIPGSTMTVLAGVRLEGPAEGPVPRLAKVSGNSFRNMINYWKQMAIEVGNYDHAIITDNVFRGNFSAPEAIGICSMGTATGRNNYMVVTGNQFLDWDVGGTGCPIRLSSGTDNSIGWIVTGNQFDTKGTGSLPPHLFCGDTSKLPDSIVEDNQIQ